MYSVSRQETSAFLSLFVAVCLLRHCLFPPVTFFFSPFLLPYFSLLFSLSAPSSSSYIPWEVVPVIVEPW